MARKRTEPASPTHLVPPLLKLALARGIDIAALIGRFHLPADSVKQSEVPISTSELGELLDVLAEQLDEPHLGLVLPEVLSFTRYDLPELVARSSPTLRDALKGLVQYAPLLNESVAFSLEEDAASGSARFAHRVLGHPRGVSRHLNEFAIASGLYHGRQRTGLAFAVREVHFIHPRPPSLETLRSYFGTAALRFGHVENALVLDLSLLDAPQLTSDPRLLVTVESLAAEALKRRPAGASGEWRNRLERLLREELEAGHELGVRRLARSLHMSVRTLQRRLDDEGTTFGEVLDSVREGLARELVARPEPALAEVAFRLGFSELATFSRAFKRWTGEAPGAFRKEATGEQPA